MKTFSPISTAMSILLISVGGLGGQPAPLQANPVATQPRSATTRPTGDAVLPSGHVPLSASTPDQNKRSSTPTGHSYSFYAQLDIKVDRPGTVGPSLAGLPITVWLIHRDQPIRKYNRQLGASGSLRIRDIKLSVPVMPLIRIRYDQVDYEMRGPVLNSRRPSAQIKMAVYPTTLEKPALSIQMRHVMLRLVDHGLQVREMIALHNPAKYAWIRPDTRKTIQKKDTQGTFHLKLCSNIRDIQLGKGFSRQYTRYQDGVLLLNNPIQPGTHAFELNYTLKPVGGKYILTLQAPEKIKFLMISVPDHLKVLQTQRLTPNTQANLSKRKIKIYQIKNLPSRAIVRMELKVPVQKRLPSAREGSS